MTRFQASDSFLLSLLPPSAPFQGIIFTLYYTTDGGFIPNYRGELNLCTGTCSEDENIGATYENIPIPNTDEDENATFVHGNKTVGIRAYDQWDLC